MLRRLVVTTLVAAAIRPADGQIIRRNYAASPAAWSTFSVGLFQSGNVADGTTGSTWNFGDALQYRATLEKALQGQTSIGVAATFARVPLTYQSTTSVTCFSCDADANVTQVFGSLHNGGATLGFYQVIDLELGATIYSNFRVRSSGERLTPSSDPDFAFGIGYGFGFALSPTTRVELVQQFGASLHQRTGLEGSSNSAIRSSVTRIGVRFGLGEKR